MSGKQSKSLLPIVWQTALLALSLTSLSHGQTTALTFRPVGAEYSLALDRIIMISSNPNLLHIYDPSSNADTTVRLSNAPLNFSVGPDGLHAAVAYTASVDYINLQSAAAERNYLVSVSTGSPVIGDYRIGKVVLGTTYFYILSSGNSGLAISVNLFIRRSYNQRQRHCVQRTLQLRDQCNLRSAAVRIQLGPIRCFYGSYLGCNK
ncbi:MAG: hypothetical protein ACJ73N_07045 [Bryobacteraceae bacterium]